MKHQLKELQKSSDDTTNIRPEKREQVVLEQANICQQIVELQDQMSISDAAVHNAVDAEGKNMEAVLDNCKGINYVQCRHSIVTIIYFHDVLNLVVGNLN